MDSEKPGSLVLKDVFFVKEGPNRTRKAGRCISNLYCPYDDYPFRLSADR